MLSIFKDSMFAKHILIVMGFSSLVISSIFVYLVINLIVDKIINFKRDRGARKVRQCETCELNKGDDN